MKTLLYLFLVPFLLYQGNSPETWVKGFWLNETEDMIVEIYRKNGLFYGRVVWLREPLDMYGQQLRDVMNYDPKQRSRPVIGLDVLTDFEWSSDAWRNGRVYNYKTGNNYNAKMSLDEDGNLRLTGFYGILFFLGRTKIWTPVADKHEFGLK